MIQKNYTIPSETDCHYAQYSGDDFSALHGGNGSEGYCAGISTTLPLKLITESLHPLGIGTTEDIANACIYLLSDAARWVTGQNLIVDGGYTVK